MTAQIPAAIGTAMTGGIGTVLENAPTETTATKPDPTETEATELEAPTEFEGTEQDEHPLSLGRLEGGIYTNTYA